MCLISCQLMYRSKQRAKRFLTALCSEQDIKIASVKIAEATLRWRERSKLFNNVYKESLYFYLFFAKKESYIISVANSVLNQCTALPLLAVEFSSSE